MTNPDDTGSGTGQTDTNGHSGQTGTGGGTGQTGNGGGTGSGQTEHLDAQPTRAENSAVIVGQIPDDPAVLAQIDTSWSTDSEVA
jgi:hypothetical protein